MSDLHTELNLGSIIADAYAYAVESAPEKDSKAIGDLLKNPNKFFWMILAVVVVLIVILVVIVILIVKLVKGIIRKHREKQEVVTE